MMFKNFKSTKFFKLLTQKGSLNLASYGNKLL
jgi:hypothetical protein